MKIEEQVNETRTVRFVFLNGVKSVLNQTYADDFPAIPSDDMFWH